MASPDTYNVPPMPHNAMHPSSVASDICYLPSAPMQPAPHLYPSVAPAPPPPPPYVVSPAVQMQMNPPQHPMYITQVQVPYQGVILTGNMTPPQTVHIKDYMVWSIINVFLGGFILGFIAVFLSSQTRRRKQEGDVHGARTMSNITLIFNILITIIFFATTAFLIIYFVIIFSSLDEIYK
jgi:hypothetical protein